MAATAKLYTDPSDISGVILDSVGTQNGITAFSGGGQASAVLLSKNFSRVTTVAAGNDSVRLPAALAGSRMVVFNKAAANSLNIFPAVGDQINALGANTAYALVVTKGVEFICMVAGTWDTILTA